MVEETATVRARIDLGKKSTAVPLESGNVTCPTVVLCLLFCVGSLVLSCVGSLLTRYFFSLWTGPGSQAVTGERFPCLSVMRPSNFGCIFDDS